LERKIFIVLISLLVLAYTGWYIIVDYSNTSKLKLVDRELAAITKKLNHARHAQNDYANIQKKYESDQKRLIQERTRFVGKDELSEVTRQLQKFAKDFNLKLMDFSPILETYFAANPEDKIISLPIEIAVHGGYLDAGLFVENWHKLSFYLIPEEIEIERIDPDDNQLDVMITASLYTWNE